MTSIDNFLNYFNYTIPHYSFDYSIDDLIITLSNTDNEFDRILYYVLFFMDYIEKSRIYEDLTHLILKYNIKSILCYCIGNINETFGSIMQYALLFLLSQQLKIAINIYDISFNSFTKIFINQNFRFFEKNMNVKYHIKIIDDIQEFEKNINSNTLLYSPCCPLIMIKEKLHPIILEKLPIVLCNIDIPEFRKSYNVYYSNLKDNTPLHISLCMQFYYIPKHIDNENPYLKINNFSRKKSKKKNQIFSL